MKAVRALRCFLLCAEPRELEDELLGSSSLPPEIAKLFDTARSSAPRHVSRILAPHLASRNLLREPEKETERERVTAFDDETGINAENCSSHWACRWTLCDSIAVLSENFYGYDIYCIRRDFSRRFSFQGKLRCSLRFMLPETLRARLRGVHQSRERYTAVQ